MFYSADKSPPIETLADFAQNTRPTNKNRRTVRPIKSASVQTPLEMNAILDSLVLN